MSENKSTCNRCGNTGKTLHHISYIPEIVMRVCNNCHGRIHSMGYDGEPFAPELTPEISRKEWIDRVAVDYKNLRPDESQIEWMDNGHGQVRRGQ